MARRRHVVVVSDTAASRMGRGDPSCMRRWARRLALWARTIWPARRIACGRSSPRSTTSSPKAPPRPSALLLSASSNSSRTRTSPRCPKTRFGSHTSEAEAAARGLHSRQRRPAIPAPCSGGQQTKGSSSSGRASRALPGSAFLEPRRGRLSLRNLHHQEGVGPGVPGQVRTNVAEGRTTLAFGPFGGPAKLEVVHGRWRRRGGSG